MIDEFADPAVSLQDILDQLTDRGRVEYELALAKAQKVKLADKCRDMKAQLDIWETSKESIAGGE